MSAATITVGSPAWNRLKQEVAEHKITPKQLNEKLAGSSPIPGIAAAPGTTALSPKAAAERALDAAANPPGPGLIGQALGAVGEAGKAAGGLVTEGAAAATNAVGEGLINWIKPEAEKLTLYAVLIFGAVAMIVFGLSELLKPVGGPSLRSMASAGRLAKVAAAA